METERVEGILHHRWVDPTGEVVQFQDVNRIYIDQSAEELCIEGAGGTQLPSLSYEIPDDIDKGSALQAVELWARYVKARRIKPPYPGTHWARRFGCRCSSSCGRAHNPDCAILDHPNLPRVKGGVWKTGDGKRSVLFSNLGAVKVGKVDKVNGNVNVRLTTRHDPDQVEEIILRYYEADDLCQQFDTWQAGRSEGGEFPVEPSDMWADPHGNIIYFQNCRKVFVREYGDGEPEATLVIEGDQPGVYLIPKQVSREVAEGVVLEFQRFLASCVDPDPDGASYDMTLTDILTDLAHRLMEQNTEALTNNKALRELVSLLTPPERFDPFSVPIPTLSSIVGREPTPSERHSFLAGVFYMADRVMKKSNSQSTIDFVRDHLYKTYDEFQVATVVCSKCHIRVPAERTVQRGDKLLGADCCAKG
jgi:hypothetical protein